MIPGETEIQLRNHLEDWEGTPYRNGGLDREGIDCSGFVHVTFRDIFGIELPRTTSTLGGVGKKIRLRELGPGDLLFFKTGLFKRHVGIHLEAGHFIHASTSGGVTQSSLKDAYWAKRFWKARRVIFY